MSDDEIVEGFRAGLAGARYEDCPYGHDHPDVRFGPWVEGFWKATNQWCQEHNRPDHLCITQGDWMWGRDDLAECWAARAHRANSVPLSSADLEVSP